MTELSVLVNAKLRPAVAPAFAIERPVLVQRLRDLEGFRLALVVAPAGYGKSVLLSQYEQDPSRIAWLTVDERDRDPVRLGLHLLGALSTVEPTIGARAAKVIAAPGTTLNDDFIDLLLDDLARLDRTLTLVLEDVDQIDDARSIDGLARLVTESPSALRVVASARTDPPFSSHRLRVAGQLAEMRADDLAFTAEETAQAVTSLSGKHIAPDVIDHVHRITEGWPVAVQLAALSVRSADDTLSLLRFGAGDRNVVGYLSSELLDTLTTDLRRFLLECSVLEEMRPALCDAVCQRTDSARLLDELHRDAFFIAPPSMPTPPGSACTGWCETCCTTSSLSPSLSDRPSSTSVPPVGTPMPVTSPRPRST